jgi:hypothetical protein
MNTQQIHNMIANTIDAHKRTLLDRLRNGVELELAVAQFFSELSLAFDRIIASTRQRGKP